jgi:hypothetical protein
MSRILTFILCLCFLTGGAQLLTPEKQAYTHADTLRGSVGPERAWWNLLKYELSVEPDFAGRSLHGSNAVTFAAISEGQTMQIDLQEPMQLVSATWKKKALKFTREGNVFHLQFPKPVKAGSVETVVLQYQGVPKVAVRPPVDDGSRRRAGIELLASLQGPSRRRTGQRGRDAYRLCGHAGRDRERPAAR